MKTNLLSLLAATFLATGMISISTLGAEPTAAVEAASENKWQNHVVAQMPARVNALSIEWLSQSKTKVEFRVLASPETTRYQAVRFFQEDCSGVVAALRDTLLAANKPVEYLSPKISAGKELALNGSFALCLGDKLGAVVWSPETSPGVGEESNLPKENSDYVRSLIAKIKEVRVSQAGEDLNNFVKTLSIVSGQVATATGSTEAQVLSDITRTLSGGTNQAPLPAEPSASKPNLKTGIEKGTKAVSAVVGLFRK